MHLQGELTEPRGAVLGIGQDLRRVLTDDALHQGHTRGKCRIEGGLLGRFPLGFHPLGFNAAHLRFGTDRTCCQTTT